MNFFSILRFLEKGNDSLFGHTAEEQRSYLCSLPEPKDDFDRSYNQYRCQMFFVPTWKRVIQSLVAAIIFPFITLFMLLKGATLRFVRKVPTVSDFTMMQEVVPAEVVSELEPDASVWDNVLGLKCRDVPYIAKLMRRFWRHPFFVLKVTAKQALYRALLIRYSPSTIVVHNEYSFACSIMTDYCFINGVKHIDIMHGEKLFFIRDSFFRFTRCYVWNEHYINLFLSLRAAPNQFVIAVPPSLQVNPEEFAEQAVYADVKYYLGLSSEQQFASIVDSLRPFRESGLTIKYRYHPRYSDRKILLKYCMPEELEEPDSVSIQSSISNAKYIVGSYSTVLFQASLVGKKIILDDVTYSSVYQKLLSMQYSLSAQPHIKLSEIKQKCEEL